MKNTSVGAFSNVIRCQVTNNIIDEITQLIKLAFRSRNKFKRVANDISYRMKRFIKIEICAAFSTCRMEYFHVVMSGDYSFKVTICSKLVNLDRQIAHMHV